MRNADEANEPLIGTSEEEEDERRQQIRGHDRQDAPAEAYENDLKAPGRVIWLLTASAGISGLLFGYDTGVISSMLVSIGSDLSNRAITTLDKSLITSVTSIGALIASPLTGWLADKYGRKAVILFADLLFVCGALLQAVSTQVWLVVLARAIIGLAVGSASCAVPLYITEVAPAPFRARLITVQSLFITGGQVVAYLVGWFFSNALHGWRWMVGIGCVPALVQLLLFSTMPETPRWLLRSGQEAKARAVLERVYEDNGKPNDALVEAVLGRVKFEIIEDRKLRGYDDEEDTSREATASSTLWELVAVPGNRRALSIACMLQTFQQLCGFNSLMYFSATIFTLLGYTSPIAASLSIAITNFAFTVVSFAYIDTVGRRRILLRSVPFMTIGLLLCSVAFAFIYPSGTQEKNSSWDMYYAKESAWPQVLLLSMVGYVAAYAIGLGCVPWQQSELFPQRVRSLGSSVATATNWTSNFVIGLTFLPMMEIWGASFAFGVYALVCVAGWVGIWKIYPETSGLELEAIGALLKDGWSVEESVKGFDERRRMRALAKEVD